MKILQIIPFYEPAWGFGGPVKVCKEISEKLVELNHNVTVLTTDAFDSKERVEKLNETINGVKVVRFRNAIPFLTKGYNIYTPIGFSKFIGTNLKEFDLAHLHAFFTYQNIITHRYCQRFHIPYIIHLHESLVPQLLLGKVLIKQIFNYLWGKRILLDAKGIIVVSAKEKEDLAKYMPKIANKIEVVPNSLDANKKIEKVNASRKDYDLLESDKVILCLSRLSFIKGIDRLIKAVRDLVKDDSNYKLLIIGPDEGGERQRLVDLVDFLHIRSNIKFIGLVGGKKKQELFSIADVFALFSLYESFSVTTLEALSCDVPACLSKEVGISSEVRDFDCGVVVDDTADSELAAKMLQKTFDKREELSKNCHQLVSQFDLKIVMKKILSIYGINAK